MSKSPAIGKIVEPKPSVFKAIHQEIQGLRLDIDRSPIGYIVQETRAQAKLLEKLDDQLLAFRNEHQDLIQSLQNTIWSAVVVVLTAVGVISFTAAYLVISFSSVYWAH